MFENNEPKTRSRIVFLGDEKSGKTSLCERITNNVFRSEYVATLGLEFFMKIVAHETKRVELHDCPGQSRYAGLRDIWLRHADAVVLCIDATEPAESAKIKYQKNFSNIIKCAPSAKIILALTKTDEAKTDFNESSYFHEVMGHQKPDAVIATSSKRGEFHCLSPCREKKNISLEELPQWLHDQKLLPDSPHQPVVSETLDVDEIVMPTINVGKALSNFFKSSPDKNLGKIRDSMWAWVVEDLTDDENLYFPQRLARFFAYKKDVKSGYLSRWDQITSRNIYVLTYALSLLPLLPIDFIRDVVSLTKILVTQNRWTKGLFVFTVPLSFILSSVLATISHLYFVARTAVYGLLTAGLMPFGILQSVAHGVSEVVKMGYSVCQSFARWNTAAEKAGNQLGPDTGSKKMSMASMTKAFGGSGLDGKGGDLLHDDLSGDLAPEFHPVRGERNDATTATATPPAPATQQPPTP
ncbi:MAG: hypothetical protein DHS20C10_13350 [marine bacterium B5-7]|nr:MAG: hypothetical protein DHS20C10_13350 [marine bacterium B5-7]